MVRVIIKWKYPFQPMDNLMGRQGRQDRTMESTEREERRREEAEMSQRPIAKPRAKVILNSAVSKSLGFISSLVLFLFFFAFSTDSAT